MAASNDSQQVERRCLHQGHQSISCIQDRVHRLRQRESASLTRFGCFFRPQCKGDSLPVVEGKGILAPWVIHPGETQQADTEMTREFLLSTEGSYTLSIETNQFQLTPQDKLSMFSAGDSAAGKPAGLVKSNELQFTVAP